MTAIDDLRRQQAEAQATARATAAAIAEHERQVSAEQAERRAAWDAGLVREYSRRAHELEVEARETQQAFRSAVLADPIVSAWIANRAVRYRRDALVNQVHSSLVRLGREQEMARYPVVSYRDPRLFEDVLDLAEGEAQDRGSEDSSEFDRIREQHAAGEGTDGAA